jgi:uncharacterized protein (DUF924 family)
MRLWEALTVAMEKPYSEACERNAGPILAVLGRLVTGAATVLEIGSGTGQHAVRFAQALPQVTWQPSDVPAHLAGIDAWRNDADATNVRPPIALDIDVDPWPHAAFDVVFSANTAHIVSWPQVERMFVRAAGALRGDGLFLLYGPFHYDGRATADSNRQFDASLRARDPTSGVRHLDAVTSAARCAGFELREDNALPANNRLLVFRRTVAAVPVRPDPSRAGVDGEAHAQRREVLDFWFHAPWAAGYGEPREAWFRKSSGFDAEIRDRFARLHAAAARGERDGWLRGARSALALCIVLDQFPRNMHRGTPAAFASDAKALATAREAVARGLDLELLPVQRWFVYLPFEHAEDLEAQRESVRLFATLGESPDAASVQDYARRHLDVVARFGRFPHRNAILGRDSSPEEIAFLAEPGSSF